MGDSLGSEFWVHGEDGRRLVDRWNLDLWSLVLGRWCLDLWSLVLGSLVAGAWLFGRWCLALWLET
jgi:hypothetical protein